MLASVADIEQGSAVQTVPSPLVDVAEVQQQEEESGLSLDLSFGDNFLSWELIPQIKRFLEKLKEQLGN